MGRSNYGHVPIRIPEGWRDQNRAMVIQINSLFDELYSQVADLRKELSAVKAALNEEDENNGNTDD